MVNQIRGLLSEYGVVIAQGISKVRGVLSRILEDAENGLTGLARELFADLYEQLQSIDGESPIVTSAMNGSLGAGCLRR